MNEDLANIRAEVVSISSAFNKSQMTTTKVTTLMRTSAHGRPYSQDMEAHAIACLATGASITVVQNLMRLMIKFLAPDEKCQLPSPSWFRHQRRRIGLESELLTFVKLYAAEEIMQMGFNSLVRVSTVHEQD